MRLCGTAVAPFFECARLPSRTHDRDARRAPPPARRRAHAVGAAVRAEWLGQGGQGHEAGRHGADGQDVEGPAQRGMAAVAPAAPGGARQAGLAHARRQADQGGHGGDLGRRLVRWRATRDTHARTPAHTRTHAHARTRTHARARTHARIARAAGSSRCDAWRRANVPEATYAEVQRLQAASYNALSKHVKDQQAVRDDEEEARRTMPPPPPLRAAADPAVQLGVTYRYAADGDCWPGIPPPTRGSRGRTSLRECATLVRHPLAHSHAHTRAASVVTVRGLPPWRPASARRRWSQLKQLACVLMSTLLLATPFGVRACLLALGLPLLIGSSGCLL
jgi:hypothetical protein